MAEEKKKQAVVGIISKVFAGLNGVGLIVSVLYSLYVRTRFMAIFEDLGVSLPVLTRLFLGTRGVVWIMVGLILLVLLVAKEWMRPKGLPFALNIFFFLLGIVYWILFSAAMFVPMAEVMQQTSG